MLDKEKKELIFDCLTGKSLVDKNWAIEMLYEEFEHFLFRKLRYQFNKLSEDESRDIVQDAFLKLATTSALPKNAEALISWLLAVVNNTALDLFKKAYRVNELPMPDDDLSEGYCESDNVSLVAPFNISDCVDKGIKKFSNSNSLAAAAITMSLNDFSVEEISTVIERSLGATKQFIYESKKKLKPYIEHCWSEG